jgi:spore germination cell wall hydrolase CwlJ-like protein|tara:strand:+ start:110 stop:655 length:546 start_codon:yes stop_codon:yes gene_type:complete
MEYNATMNKTIVATLLLSCLSLSAYADNTRAEDPLTCLANNIYHEAKGQPDAGQVAVGLVVINRMKDNRYPNSVCDVVYQARMKESWKTKQHKWMMDRHRIYYPIRHKCQFSWYCDGKKDVITDKVSYSKIYMLSKRILSGRYDGLIEGATHYHADYVKPSWWKTKTYIGQIADHIFYRWD